MKNKNELDQIKEHHKHGEEEDCGCALCQMKHLGVDEEDETCHEHEHCHHDHEHCHHDHAHSHDEEDDCGCALCQMKHLGVEEEDETCHEHEHCNHDHEHCHHDHEHCHHDHAHSHNEEEDCGCALCQMKHLGVDEEDETCHEHEHCHHNHEHCHHDHEHCHHEHCHHDHAHSHDEEDDCGCALCQMKHLSVEEEDETCHEHEHCHHDHEHCHHDHAHSHDEEDDCGCALCQMKHLGVDEEDETCHEHEHCHHDHAHSHNEEEDCGCALCEMKRTSVSHPEEQKKKAAKWTEQKILAVLAGASAVVIAFGFLGIPQWLKAALYLVLILLWGGPLLKRGVSSLRRMSLDENMLMSIAVVAAFVLGEYFEALMVTILFRIGEFLEEKAVKKSRKDIAHAVNIRPQKANRINKQGEVQEIASRSLKIGDTIQIKVGDRVPVDCRILKGESTMDRSAITGESVAVGVQEGDVLLSGEVNLSGVLTCRCESTFENSTASRIIQMVEESVAQKGKTEKLITRFAKFYTPIVVVLAVITAVLPPLLGYGRFSDWTIRALVFLVASCPCALVISVPLAFFSGVGAISKQGVIIKGTKFLEPLSKVDCVVFDKTGTLTTGELTVSDAEPLDERYDFRAITALAESFSSHPVAQAICRDFGKSSIPQEEVSNAQEMAGKGVSLIWQGKRVLCGSARLMQEHGIDLGKAPQANVYTAVDNTLIGTVTLSDIPRSDAAQTLKTLKALGVKKTVMLTGDGAASSEAVKQLVGADEVHFGLMPQDKAQILGKIKQEGRTVAFVGDGINDAPVIAAADVGFAMGLGTDAAIESADGVLMSNSLSALARVISISRRTLRVVKGNILFILLSKFLVMALGVAGFAPMWLAVFADVGVSIVTVFTSVRILKTNQQSAL